MNYIFLDVVIICAFNVPKDFLHLPTNCRHVRAKFELALVKIHETLRLLAGKSGGRGMARGNLRGGCHRFLAG